MKKGGISIYLKTYRFVEEEDEGDGGEEWNLEHECIAEEFIVVEEEVEGGSGEEWSLQHTQLKNFLFVEQEDERGRVKEQSLENIPG